ncbi:MAG: S8 family serine peptidase [Gallionella sp.]
MEFHLSPGGDGAYATGTSYAAPFVTAIIAEAEWTRPGMDRQSLEKLLQSRARDLGAPGRDNIYGWGLIQMPVECTRAAKVARAKPKKIKQTH